MARSDSGSRPHLFVLRVWLEQLGGGDAEWRGRAQHAISGEARYFRMSDDLSALLLAMLATEYEPPPNGESLPDPGHDQPPASESGPAIA